MLAESSTTVISLGGSVEKICNALICRSAGYPLMLHSVVDVIVQCCLFVLNFLKHVRYRTVLSVHQYCTGGAYSVLKISRKSIIFLGS